MERVIERVVGPHSQGFSTTESSRDGRALIAMGSATTESSRGR
jgi:hypothetical protein